MGVIPVAYEGQQRGQGPRPCSTKVPEGMTDRHTHGLSIIWWLLQ